MPDTLYRVHHVASATCFASLTHPLARPKIKRVAAILPCGIAAKIGLQFWGMHLLLKFQEKPQAPGPGPLSLPQTPGGRYSKVQSDQKSTKKAFFSIRPSSTGRPSESPQAEKLRHRVRPGSMVLEAITPTDIQQWFSESQGLDNGLFRRRLPMLAAVS
ncbi:hypothetical protein E4U57_006601 [Claviceps arundinis]|uniref:Uncharacterized protein n=1 Tax=Claviceps arundinis TaxID=1623583 RepID=A0ABQ7PGH0_9HYPO|nr:hypothetical protein E4U57_006601 [Claviceps arundinis]